MQQLIPNNEMSERAEKGSWSCIQPRLASTNSLSAISFSTILPPKKPTKATRTRRMMIQISNAAKTSRLVKPHAPIPYLLSDSTVGQSRKQSIEEVAMPPVNAK